MGLNNKHVRQMRKAADAIKNDNRVIQFSSNWMQGPQEIAGIDRYLLHQVQNHRGVYRLSGYGENRHKSEGLSVGWYHEFDFADTPEYENIGAAGFSHITHYRQNYTVMDYKNVRSEDNSDLLEEEFSIAELPGYFLLNYVSNEGVQTLYRTWDNHVDIDRHVKSSSTYTAEMIQNIHDILENPFPMRDKVLGVFADELVIPENMKKVLPAEPLRKCIIG